MICLAAGVGLIASSVGLTSPVEAHKPRMHDNDRVACEKR